MSQNQSANAGANSIIIQKQVVSTDTAQPHLKLIRPWNSKPIPDNEYWSLRPEAQTGQLVGRQAYLDILETWLNDEPEISVQVISGSAGKGKTRLALELCKETEKQGWVTGFIAPQELERFVKAQNSSHWGWPGPTLVVVDYVLEALDNLGTWLEELSNLQAEAEHPLRILLLERQAERGSGWLNNLFPGGLGRGMRKGALLDQSAPLELPGLAGVEDRLEVLKAMLDLRGDAGVLEKAKASPNFSTLLLQTDWADNPLFLLMAAILMAEGQTEALHLNRRELAQAFVGKEVERLGRLAANAGLPHRLLHHMVVLVTLCGGFESKEEILEIIRQEGVHLGHDNQDPAPVYEALRHALPHGQAGLEAIKPDVLGEVLVLDYLVQRDKESPDSSVGIVERAFKQAGQPVAVFIGRCGLDYPDESLAPKWLEGLAENVWDKADELAVLAYTLPKQSLIFRELAVNLYTQIVDLQRSDYKEDDHFLYRFAASLNNLANRLSDMGEKEPALSAAKEAVEVYQRLAKKMPQAFEPNLAMSLGTLTLIWAGLGEKDKALTCIREALGIIKAYAEKLPQAYGSLSVKMLVLEKSIVMGISKEEAFELLKAEAKAQS